MAPVHPYVYVAIIFVIDVIIYILVDLGKNNYGMPKKPEPKEQIPDFSAFELDGSIIVPRQLEEDIRSIIPNVTDEDIVLFWTTGDFRFFKEKYYLDPDDMIWLYERRKWFLKQFKRWKRMSKEFSLWNILTFGFFKD